MTSAAIPDVIMDDGGGNRSCNSAENGSESEKRKELYNKLIRAAIHSNGFFKQQQKDEPDLKLEEKEEIAKELLSKKPSIFLSRFGFYLSEQLLEYFDEASQDNYELSFYLKEARQKNCRYIRRKQIKNRRYKALQEMIGSGSDYFSEVCFSTTVFNVKSWSLYTVVL